MKKSPYLIITIDTEEEGIWNGEYKTNNNSVKNIYNLKKLQKIFDKYNVRPTYVLDYAVLRDIKAVKNMKVIHKERNCELGTHLHAWCTPPFEEDINGKNTYASNLPKKLVGEKIKKLTEIFEKKFKFKPLTYKSGRYGIDLDQIKILKKLGYKIDTSITPFLDHSKEGGPDFSNAPYKPFFISEESLFKKSNKGILEIPITTGFTRKNFRLSSKVLSFSEKIHPFFRGILSRFKIIEKITLSPELESLNSMKKLVDICIKKKLPVLHIFIHSQNIILDGTPYVKGEKNYKKFFEKLEAILEYITKEKHIESVTCSEFYEIFKKHQNHFK